MNNYRAIYEMRLRVEAGSYQLTLPKALIENALHWEGGDEIGIELKDDTIILRKEEVRKNER